MKDNFCYIHIPFCSSKCKYCRFASYWNIDLVKINIYVEKLILEINNSWFTIDNNIIKSIYFWWGTPSILWIEQLEKIINALKSKYDFDKNIEITIESTTKTLTKEKLIWWKNLWINRISLWVQTLNSDSLNEIWRWGKVDILSALWNISEYNWYHNISIDFIIWLPYVKQWEVKSNIEFLLNNYSFINHISVYMLEDYYEKWIDSMEQIVNDNKFQKIIYPKDWKKLWIKEEDYLWEYLDIKEFLKSKRFNSYEISNFSKSGYECKHNKSYWNHSNVLPFWLWAHWLLNNVRFNNSEDFSSYYLGTQKNWLFSFH